MKDLEKIKIAFVIDTIFSPTAGTEKQLLLLLKNLDRSKFEPYLCYLKSSQWLKEKFDLCPAYFIGIRSFKHPISLFNILRFAGFLHKNKIDIVQTQFRDSNIAGIIAAKVACIPAVISSRRGMPYWKNEHELALLKKLNRWVTLFVVNSCHTKKLTKKAENVPEEKIQVIYNGIDHALFQKNQGAIRGEGRRLLGIPDNSPAIGIVANLKPVKGIDVFLRAAQIVKQDVPDARFVIVGDGDEREKLEMLATELGINDSVKFLGKREDIPAILNSLDLGVLTSHFESFSNTILEYLAAGLPVVCTDVGGVREVVVDGVDGFVVQPGDYRTMADKLKTIIDRKLYEPMGKEGLKISRKFSLSFMVEQYEETYCRLAESK